MFLKKLFLQNKRVVGNEKKMFMKRRNLIFQTFSRQMFDISLPLLNALPREGYAVD